MASKSHGYLKTMMNSLRGRYATSASPELKPSATAAVDNLILKEFLPARRKKGDLAPFCVAAGLIAVSTTLGLHTAVQQLKRAPNVAVRKSRRQTLPEVVEPEHVAEVSRQFINKSFLRKVAHIHRSNATTVKSIPHSNLWLCFHH